MCAMCMWLATLGNQLILGLSTHVAPRVSSRKKIQGEDLWHVPNSSIFIMSILAHNYG